ncbi:hypothetical protein [Micromonospora sp. NPDC023644]|uniref:hypothetical protein n=1 Tax=Micromonospora sp. NPDC023644 TaxID=3154321 RepID=UPI0033C965BB
MHNRKTPHNLPEDDNIAPGLGYAIVAAASFTCALIACLIGQTTHIQVDRELYGIALSAFIVGACGYLARSAEARIRRDLAVQMEQLVDRVEETIRDTPPTVSYLPHRTRTEGQRPIAVGGEGDVVRLMPTGLDPDTAAAVRSISRRLAAGNGEN